MKGFIAGFEKVDVRELKFLFLESHVLRCFKVNVNKICSIDVQYFDALFVVVSIGG